jgi:hypothetical protein
MDLEKNEWDRERCTQAWKQWRLSVLNEMFCCVMCHDKAGGNLEPHHIKRKSLYFNLIYEVSNGVTLCRNCHRKTFGKEEEFEEIFTEYVKVSTNRATVIAKNPAYTSQLLAYRDEVIFTDCSIREYWDTNQNSGLIET